MELLDLRESIRGYFEEHPRAKKALGVATAVASNFAMVVTGSTVLGAVAGTIVDHRQNKEKVDPDMLMDFFKKAIQEPEVQDAIKDAVREGGVDVATHVSTAMNQLGAHSPDTGQFVSTMKSELTVIARELGIIREMISYYEIPDTRDRVMNVWRLPTYLDDVLVIDDGRKAVINAAIKHVRKNENVVILGGPGSGKTTIMYAIWKELETDTDTALVWDTKDVSKLHERDGVVLFCDDLPETRELTRAIVEKDVRGVVTTAREQEWSRLPLEVRERFQTVTLPNLKDEVMSEIASKHLRSQNVEYDDDALEEIVENAQGSPIYVRYLAEEIGAEYRNGYLTKLIRDRAMRAPKGMTDYVAGILARILFDLKGTIYAPKEGALPVIKTLLCLADMPNYETHEVHLNQVFFASKQPSDGPGPFNAIKQYLSRDPRFYSLKFMHDTLADVLRGSVGHPIVGDIRMVAQEMGVAGRRRVEKQALDDGWDHIKAEYEIDTAGGLEPLLAYAYFAAKNFGVEHIDNLALKLANEHIESPLSQGLFAISGPLTEVPEKVESPSVESEVQDSEKIVERPPTPKAPAKPSSTQDIGQLIREKVSGVLGIDAAREIEESVSSLANLSELSELGKLKTDDIGARVSKFIEGQLGEGEESKTSFDLLEEILQQESVSPAKLSRRLRKAAHRATVRGNLGKIKDSERINVLLEEGAKRLVLLDSMLYIEILDTITQGIAATSSDRKTARKITSITEEIAVALLDDKSQKSITDVYTKGVERSAKMSDYDGMLAYYEGKWRLFSINPKDLSKISDQIAKLMKLGRTPYSLEVLEKCLGLFHEDQVENHLGMTLQAFRDLSKASIGERYEYGEIVESARGFLRSQIGRLREENLLVSNTTAADLCTSIVQSMISAMDGLVKKSGKSVAVEGVYPLLHQSLKPLVMDSIEVVKEIGIEKVAKTLTNIVRTMKGESKYRDKMVEAAKSVSG
ncbi:MAG: hypothetical protein RTU30_05910 [Candidatus Thorarchaeota archaeon]